MKIPTDMWDRKKLILKEENREFAKNIKCSYTEKCNMKGAICQCCSYYKGLKRK